MRKFVILFHVQEYIGLHDFFYVSADQKDACKCAHKIVLGLQPWSYSWFHDALSTSRPEAERASIMDHFYNLCEEEIAKNPAKIGRDLTHVYLHIAKVV